MKCQQGLQARVEQAAGNCGCLACQQTRWVRLQPPWLAPHVRADMPAQQQMQSPCCAAAGSCTCPWVLETLLKLMSLRDGSLQAAGLADEGSALGGCGCILLELKTHD